MRISETIVGALKKITGVSDPRLEFTSSEQFGDYSSNIALITFSKSQVPKNKLQTSSKNQKSKFRNPRELAEEIKTKLEAEIGNKGSTLAEVVDKVEVAGPGFINFWLKSDVLIDNLTQINTLKDKHGRSDFGKGKLAIVEYSSPNIAKPFTIGHLRSTIIGDAVANLLEFSSWKVLRDNHLGDWGTQFGKQIYAVKTWGKKGKEVYSVKELVALYVKFHEEAEKDPALEDEARLWFKRLEEGDKDARELWQKCVDWSWEEFDKIYKILGVTFSKEFNGGRGLGESFFEDKMKIVVDEMDKKGLLETGKEGAKLVFFKNDKYPPAMIIKKDGTSLYHTRDLATDKYRKTKYNPDLVINEVGSEQKLYFEQLFEMEKQLGWFLPGQRVHVGHGMVRFKEGKMSTRRGNVVWMEDVLRLARDKAKSLRNREESFPAIENLSSDPNEAEYNSNDWVVAIGALKYNDLKRDPSTNIVFDWDEILNMEGNSGPYLQYTVARCNSVIQKAPTLQVENLQVGKELNTTNINTEELVVLRVLSRFHEVVEDAAKNYSPNLLCNYLYELAQKYNSFYNKHRILVGEHEALKHKVQITNKSQITNSKSQNDSNLENSDLSQQDFRLALTFAVGVVLKNGLNLLGIEAPERM